MDRIAVDNSAGRLAAGRRETAIWLLCAGLVMVALAFAFAPPLQAVWTKWQRPEYSHGFLIPLLAFVILWHRLAEIRPVPRPAGWGIAVIAAGFALLVAGDLSTFNSAALYGLVVALAGCVAAFLGPRALRLAAPALVYLCFAIPPPDFLYADMSESLQLSASTFATDILDFFNVPVAQDGNVIDFGVYQLQVAEACSGLRYLFPLASFSFLVALIWQDRLWKRLVLFLSAIPIAILLNILRIVLAGVLVDNWGMGMAQGFVHAFQGWAIFLVCLGLLAAEAALLKRIHRYPGSVFRFGYLDIPHLPVVGRLPRAGSVIFATTGAVLVLALGVTLSLGLLVTRTQPPQDVAVSGFPSEVGDWLGEHRALDADSLNVLNLTSYFLADYREHDLGTPVNFYAAYYAQQDIGSAAHSPARCIPGSGWTILDHSQIAVQGPAGAAAIRLNRLKIRLNGADQLVYYWFYQRGRDLTDEWAVKWYLFRDRLATGRSDGYLLRVVTPVTDGHEAEADARLRRFLAAAWPYLPHEGSVKEMRP